MANDLSKLQPSSATTPADRRPFTCVNSRCPDRGRIWEGPTPAASLLATGRPVLCPSCGDVAVLTPGAWQAQPAPSASPDAVEAAKTWLKALGRKSSEQDLLDEPAPHRNRLIRGASEWLDAYTGDFDYLLSLQDTKRSLRRGQVFPSYRQAAGILNCLRAEMARQERTKAQAAPAVRALVEGAIAFAREENAKAPVQAEYASRSGFAVTPAAPAAPAGPIRIAVEDQGVYVLADGSIVRVKANREKTKTYALRFVEHKSIERATVAGDGIRAHGEFQYEAGLIHQVAENGRKMSLEEAKAFTLRFGFCVRCGRALRDAKSVEQGMGPVCIKYFRGA